VGDKDHGHALFGELFPDGEDFTDLGISAPDLPVAAPPQADRATTTASPAAAVWNLLMVFMMLPFKGVLVKVLIGGLLVKSGEPAAEFGQQ
jgi:hypothetical protein